MRLQPRLGFGMGQLVDQDLGRHRQQAVQIEGAFAAHTHEASGPRGARLDPFAELPGQDAAALDGERADLFRLGGSEVEEGAEKSWSD